MLRGIQYRFYISRTTLFKDINNDKLTHTPSEALPEPKIKSSKSPLDSNIRNKLPEPEPELNPNNSQQPENESPITGDSGDSGDSQSPPLLLYVVNPSLIFNTPISKFIQDTKDTGSFFMSRSMKFWNKFKTLRKVESDVGKEGELSLDYQQHFQREQHSEDKSRLLLVAFSQLIPFGSVPLFFVIMKFPHLMPTSFRWQILTHKIAHAQNVHISSFSQNFVIFLKPSLVLEPKIKNIVESFNKTKILPKDADPSFFFDSKTATTETKISPEADRGTSTSWGGLPTLSTPRIDVESDKVFDSHHLTLDSLSDETVQELAEFYSPSWFNRLYSKSRLKQRLKDKIRYLLLGDRLLFRDNSIPTLDWETCLFACIERGIAFESKDFQFEEEILHGSEIPTKESLQTKLKSWVSKSQKDGYPRLLLLLDQISSNNASSSSVDISNDESKTKNRPSDDEF